ncbi:MAG: SMP-30/gluconolactonase/LRE family protein [Synoicihabitans sp.]
MSALIAGTADSADSHSPRNALPVGDFSSHGDIGNPAITGSSNYGATSQSYTMTAAGKNLWGAEDEFQFAWNEIAGDFIVRARVNFVGEGIDPHRKAGWMIRADLDKGSAYADGCIHGDGLTSLQYRAEKDGETAEVILENLLNGTVPDVLQFERRDGTFIFSAARYGEPLKSVELSTVDLPDRVYVGLFLCSHREDVVEQAIFRDVRIIKPAAPDFRPYQDYLGSNLEALDVFSGKLMSLHRSSESFEAPNWTVDGERLILNISGTGPAKGELRNFDLDTRRISKLNTGEIVQNNNDHVLSFDGKLLGISSHEGPDRTSVIYTLPSTGSDHPTAVTDAAWGHSFLHGWSPDNRWLVYTANRKNQWDIYKVDRFTREEVQLTDSDALDDGSEYSPDGQWIYFNSARTGYMQIWRMRPDGSDQEQVFADQSQNWFPHISPDGKWMVFLSYDADQVAADQHPYYQHVTISLMPTDGSTAPRIVAYVYGGQGTINVPSWSPDSRSIAFVSNTGAF